MLEKYCNQKLFDEMFEGMYVVDTKRTIMFWNKAAEIITGFSADEVIGSKCYDNILKHVDQNGRELCFGGCPLNQTIIDGTVRKANVYLHHKMGHRVPVSIKTIPLFEHEKVVGSVEFMVDTSFGPDLNDEVKKYKSLAMKDQLTSIPNRFYVKTYLELKMQEYKTLNLPFAIAFIDIDHFKVVNDTYGHGIGDEVLKMVARTFVNASRGNDLIGRWGGEEFLAVFTNCQENVLTGIVEKIRMLVEKSTLGVGNVDINVTISIGATIVRTDDTIESIIKRADDLMYQSKANGRNRCTID